jgi:hypothetical protein
MSSAKLKVALPGYNALTDTNLDHYSVYSDQDNILIKEYSRFQGTISSGGSQTINHNFNYIPFFMSFAYQDYGPDGAGTFYTQLGHNAFDVSCSAYSNNNTLTLSNYLGSAVPFTSYVFYDGFTNGTPSFVESDIVFKVAKSGKSISSTNPNDFIIHSDLNGLKIIKEGTYTFNLTDYYNNVSFAHNGSISTAHAYLMYIKFPDNSVTKVSSNIHNFSKDGNYSCSQLLMDKDKFYLSIGSGYNSFSATVKYYIFESPLSGTIGKTINLSDHLLRIAKSGYDASSDTEADHYNFLSGFNTLKYYALGTANLTIIGNGETQTALGSVYHGLGYYPVIECMTNDNLGGGTLANTYYATVPFDTSAFAFTDIANCYWDTNYVYFEFSYSGTETITQNFYYKLFKNNLGF